MIADFHLVNLALTCQIPLHFDFFLPFQPSMLLELTAFYVTAFKTLTRATL